MACMKVLILSDINSAHTEKWSVALAKKGIEIAVFSLTVPRYDWYSAAGIRLFAPGRDAARENRSDVSKLAYLSSVPRLKAAIRAWKPQIVHAHYATSYGILGALAGFHPYIISAWGSDVLEFPHRSFVNKLMLKYNFRKADYIFATSRILVSELKQYTGKPVRQIAFGIDMDHFKPAEVAAPVFPKGSLVVGTVKSLETMYGTDILIKAFAQVKARHPDKMLKLLIVGKGTRAEEYKALAASLNLSADALFTGKVKYEEVLGYHNTIDIFVNVSRNESFGVAVLEASACGNPVIACNVGGVKEVVQNGVTGFLVEKEDVEGTAAAMEKLVTDGQLREQMGKAGRVFVEQTYDFTKNLEQTCACYEEIVAAEK